LGVRYNLRFSIQLIEIIKDNIHLGVRCEVGVRFSPPRPFNETNGFLISVITGIIS